MTRRYTAQTVVTGGAGFIGSNLAKRLADRGHRVTVIDDLSSGFKSNLEGLRVTLQELDVAILATDVGQGWAMVYDLPASVGNKRAIDHPIRDSKVNVIGTHKVLEVAREHDVPTVVLSSFAGIFGELKTLPISEDHSLDPDSSYGVSKLAAEKHGMEYSKLYTWTSWRCTTSTCTARISGTTHAETSSRSLYSGYSTGSGSRPTVMRRRLRTPSTLPLVGSVGPPW